LPKAFGRDDLGATGVAGGVERIILSLDKQGVVPSRQSQLVSVLYATSEMQEEATNLTSQLRSEGISVVIDLAGRPLKKQIELATNSKYASIVGSKEFSEDKVVLRNMQDRTEKQILVDDLITNSKSILS
jgi:histidyl-tRNA synthetase